MTRVVIVIIVAMVVAAMACSVANYRECRQRFSVRYCVSQEME